MSSKIPLQAVSSMAGAIVDWKVLAAWVETEGSINCTIDFKLNRRTGVYNPRVVRAILIPQGERAPLGSLQEFLLVNGVHSYLRLLKPSRSSFSQKPYYRLEIQRMEDIDRVVEHIRDYLLTDKGKNQLGFYLFTRHMNSAQLREKFLQSWIESRKDKKRRGRKGQRYVY